LGRKRTNVIHIYVRQLRPFFKELSLRSSDSPGKWKWSCIVWEIFWKQMRWIRRNYFLTYLPASYFISENHSLHGSDCELSFCIAPLETLVLDLSCHLLMFSVLSLLNKWNVLPPLVT
jgi:hypothetical protein